MHSSNLFSLIIILPIIIFSVIVHENAHGLMALALGDKTAKNAGRLTLNPIKHADPFGSLLLPLMSWFVFGWPIGYAKPVPINPMYFKNQRYGMMLTGLAGPLSNIMLGVVVAMLLKITSVQIFIPILIFATLINFALAIFNLLPLPPLDGSRVAAALIPRRWLASYYQLERYGILIIFLFVFLFPGILSRLMLFFIGPMFKLLGVESVLKSLGV